MGRAIQAIPLKAVFALLVGVAAGWFARATTISAPVAATPYVFNDWLDEKIAPHLSATGSWQGDIASSINTVRISCDPESRGCDVVQADLLQGTAVTFLGLSSDTFHITKIDARTVVAERDAMCVRLVLTMDRSAKAVTLVRTKIKLDEPCSLVQDAPVPLVLGNPRAR